MHLHHEAAGGADAVLIGQGETWGLSSGVAMLRRRGGTLRYVRGGEVDAEEFVTGGIAGSPLLRGPADTILQIETNFDFHSPTFLGD